MPDDLGDLAAEVCRRLGHHGARRYLDKGGYQVCWICNTRMSQLTQAEAERTLDDLLRNLNAEKGALSIVQGGEVSVVPETGLALVESAPVRKVTALEGEFKKVDRALRWAMGFAVAALAAKIFALVCHFLAWYLR